MWWVLLILAILTLICFIPVGITLKYDHSGFKLFFKVGFFRFSLLDDKKKKAKRQTGSKSSKAGKKTAKSQGGKITDFIPVAKAIYAFLNCLRKRIVVTNLRFKITLAGSDPCDLSVLYGRTWAAVGAFQPHLNRFLKIRKQKINVQCDYTAEHTTVLCYVDTSISIVRLLNLILKHGTKISDEYEKMKNQRKGGTVYESETSSDA